MNKRKQYGIITERGELVKSDILESYSIKSSNSVIGDGFENTYGTDNLVSPLYNPMELAKLIELNTYHMRACRTKARDTAGIGYNLISTNDENKKTIKDFLNNLDDNLNEIVYRTMYDYESIGYGALEITKDIKDTPNGIYHVPAHTLRVSRKLNKYKQRKGNNTVWFKKLGYEKDVDKNTGKEYPLGTLNYNDLATELIWFNNYTSRSDYYGISDILPAIGAVIGDVSRRDFNIAFFKNYGVPAYAVFISGNFDADTDEEGNLELANQIKEYFGQVNSNPHSSLIIPIPTDGNNDVKVEFEPLNTDIKEASFRLYRSDNRDEVLSSHGVPPYRCGIAETGSLGSNVAKESTEIYKVSVIEPKQMMIESSINKFIINKLFGIEDVIFELFEIDTQDEAHEIEMCQKLFNMGAITPNEIIRKFSDRFGLEESDVEEMNWHYINNKSVEGGVYAPAIMNAVNEVEKYVAKRNDE